MKRWRVLTIGLITVVPVTAGNALPQGMRTLFDELGLLNFRGVERRFAKQRDAFAQGGNAYWQASLGLAIALHYKQPDTRKDKQLAAQLYDDLIAGTGHRDLRVLALLLRARLAARPDYFGDTADHDLARDLFTRILTEHPESELVHLAATYRAHLDIMSMRKDTALRGINDMQDWIAAHAGNPLESLQWQVIARAWMYPLEDFGRALEAFQRAEAAGLPRHTSLDQYLWRLGSLAEKAGRADLAIRCYRRILSEVQRPANGFNAQSRLRALGVEPPPLPDPFADRARPSPWKTPAETQGSAAE